MKPRIDYSLYLATGRAFLRGRDLAAVVEEAVAAGVTLVQLREKTAGAREFYEIGRRLHAVTRRLRVPLIINDRLDIALALDAEGIHVGQDDLPLERVRALAPGRIVGFSVQTVADAEFAARTGADYLGVGPVFTTATKADAGEALGLEGLRRVVAASSLPCVAIGGITPANAADALACGAAGCCVISALLGAPDLTAAVAAFRAIVRPRRPHGR